MSQSSSKSRTTGELFATPNAPFVEYLKALRRGKTAPSRVVPDALAEVLQGECVVPQDSEPRGRWKDSDPKINHLADIIDIHSGRTIKKTRTITRTDLSDPNKRASCVDDFVDGMRYSEDGIETRILFLQCQNPERQIGRAGSRRDIDSEVIECLFLAHIMAMELDLGYSDLADLLNYFPVFRNVGYREAMFNAAGCTPGHLLFSEPFLQYSYIQARSLGMRQLGAHHIHHVAIMLFLDNISTETTLLSAAATTGMNFKPSKIKGNPDNAILSTNMKDWTHTDRFMLLLENSLQHSSQSSSTVTTYHWLDAILRLLNARLSSSLRSVNTNKNDEDKLWKANSSAQALFCSQSALDQVEHLFLADGVQEPRECSSSMQALRLLAKTAQNRATVEQTSLDRDVTLSQMDMTELSIAESRSAIALTVLAFVFVPISLASSIFGMNVREITASGPSIYAFVITAVVMLAVSGLAWMLWRASRNIVLVHRHLTNPDVTTDLDDADSWYMANWLKKLGLINKTFRETHPISFGLGKRLRDASYWLGLRSIEKRGEKRDVLSGIEEML